MKTREELLASVIAQRLGEKPVGVVIDGFGNLDVANVVRILAGQNKELFVCSVGYGPVRATKRFQISDKIEDAVTWRNRPDCAGKIVVFLRREVPKRRSLSDFQSIHQRDVSDELITTARKQLASNEPERNFWDGIRRLRQTFPLQLLEQFVQTVTQHPGKTNERIPKSLWSLGLACDDDVLKMQANPVDRLARNRQAIEAIGQLSEQSRRRMAQVIGTYNGPAKKKFNAAYQAVMDYFKGGDLRCLSSLDLETLELLIKSGKPLPKSSQTSIEVVTPVRNGDRPLRGKRLSAAIATAIVSQDPDQLSDLENFAEGLSALFDDPGEAQESLSIGEALVEPTNTEERWSILNALAYCSSQDAWGGWFESDSMTLNEAFRNFDEHAFHPHSPEKSSVPGGISLGELFNRFDYQLSKKGGLEKIFKRLKEYRERIISFAPLLVCHPFVPLSTDKNLRKVVAGYLQSYGELLNLFNSCESDLHRVDSQATRIAVAELLRLDVIYIRVSGEWKALLTPLHPFFLWRYHEILQGIDDRREGMADAERELLATAMTDVPQVLHFLVSIPASEGVRMRVLPVAGRLFELPTYENDTNRYLGSDGVEYLSTVLKLWLSHAPYSRRQVRIALIDVPEMKSVLETLTEFLGEYQDTTIIADIYRTRRSATGDDFSTLEFSGADYQVTELLRERRLQIRFPQLARMEDIERHLQEKAVHLCFAFDQAAFQLEHAPRPRGLVVSPLVVTYQYDYNKILKRGTITPSTDTENDGLFRDFNFLVRKISDLGPDQLPRLHTGEPPNVSFLKSVLSKGLAQWLICADRDLSSYSLSGQHDVIQLLEAREGQRELGVWACPTDRTFHTVNQVLDQYPIEPDPDKVRKVFQQFAYVAATGWKSLLQTGSAIASRSAQDSLKGAIGAVIAAAWYSKTYPNALIATLDSELAMQWLVGRDELTKRADLVGLRVEKGNVVVEPIEVKSQIGATEVRVERQKQSNRKSLSGRAVLQLTDMLETLRPIFGLAERQPLFTDARREALKYQLHRECFRDVHAHELREQWYETLQEAFGAQTRTKVTLQGMIIQIKFEELADLVRTHDSAQPLELVEIGTREIQKLLSDEDENNEDSDEGDDEPSGSGPGVVLRTITKQVFQRVVTSHSVPKTNQVSREPKRNRWTEPKEEVEELARGFRRACQSFSISLSKCESSDAVIGPNVVRLYFQLGRGQRRAKLDEVLEDMGREMRRSGLVVTPIEHSDQLALDVPRLSPSKVLIEDALAALPKLERFEQLPIPIGVTPEGQHVIRDLDRMPHLLVAGTTGAGKSVFLYGILASLLKTHPDSKSLRILLSSSKKEDFSVLKGLRHLEGRSVIDEASGAIELLQGKVQHEIEARRELLDKTGCRDIVAYNLKHQSKPIPPMVIIVDEFADLCDQFGLNRKAKTAFYTSIRQVAQAGRSRGVHLVLCTQRPSAQLLPTDIRSLMNLRVALRMIKREDSVMIIEEPGAEQLQMYGDLLMKDDKGLRRALGYYTDVDFLAEIVKTMKE